VRADREPLFDAQEIEGSVDDGLLGELASAMPDPNESDPDEVYSGRDVRWLGLSGRMYCARWDQVHATPGNQFDGDKLATFAALFEENPGILIEASPAQATVIGRRDVQESQRSARDSELFVTFGMSRPLTTGDEDLDAYLIDPKQYIRDNVYDVDDAKELEADLLERLGEAEKQRRGDLGKYVFQLRDGNHRAFAAQLAGEPYVWLLVRSKYMQNDLPDGELE
jgi:hypothetical protein